MRKVGGGVVCAVVAVAVALVTMVFAAGAADPEADSAALALWLGAVLGLAATAALLAVVASALRTSSERIRDWRDASPLGYWLAVGVATGLAAAEVASSAVDELELDALYLAGALGLLVGLTVLMLERVAWGVAGAATLALALGVLGFREGPYEATVGYWLPRLLLFLVALAALSALMRRAVAERRDKKT